MSSIRLVAGLGKTGHSIARYLTRRKLDFVVYDTRKTPPDLESFHQEFPGVKVYCAELPEALYGQIEEIICSPGVPIEEPVLQKALTKNIPVIGDIECLAREVTAPLIAITGTNGKSTVTTLVGEMAKAAGLSVAVAGNIGLPVLDILDVGVRYDLWVLELSSFQLDLTHSLQPFAATILNITPDHIDRHHSFAAYKKAKHRSYHRAQNIIYNRDDDNTKPEAQEAAQSKLISFGYDKAEEGNWGLLKEQDQYFLAKGSKNLFPVSELKIKGRHNWMNALAACALADAAGILPKFMLDVLKRFGGLPHRSQWIRSLDGVDWINDSKGTNVGATVSAISGIGSAMSGKIVLIAGGQGKGADFSDLRQSMTDYVRTLVLIGEDAKKIEEAVTGSVKVLHAASLKAAVMAAKAEAKPGDVVLLSPACASFDMFRDFNHRGDDFAAAALAL